MNFIAHTHKEYIDTVISLFESGVFKDSILNNIFDIEEETINKTPIKYPVLINIEMEEWEADNKCFTFNGISFVYLNDVLNGSKYQKYLKILGELDLEEAALSEIIYTSGLIDKPIDELEVVRNRIEELEEILF